MKIWLTEILAIDPNNPERGLVKWCGPDIKALTEQHAKEYCQNNGLGYCRVIGELVMEIPCKKGTYEPDFNNAVDYEQSQLN
jgi:hypothetical protein